MAQRTLYLYSDQGLLAEATQHFVLDPRLTATTVDAPQPGVIAGPRPVITGPLPMVVGASGVSAAPMIAGSGVVSGVVGSTSSTNAIRMASVPVAVPVAIQAASASPRALSADGGEAINIGPAAPAITTQYGLRPGSPWGTAPLFIQTKNSAGQTSMAYYHHDQLGTPLQATDKAGNIVWAASFDAFGRASITTPQATVDKPTVASNLRLPGQYEDGETGLHYNWHRYYDAEVGRYVTSDPIGLEGGINFYSYAGGSPISRVDPMGLADFLGSCKGRYANCAASQDPNASTFGNWARWKVCEASIDKACSAGFPFCCDVERQSCMADAAGDAKGTLTCVQKNAKCVQKGK